MSELLSMSSLPEEGVPAFCEGARRLSQGLAYYLAAEGLGLDVMLCLLRLIDRRTRPEASEVFSCRFTTKARRHKIDCQVMLNWLAQGSTVMGYDRL